MIDPSLISNANPNGNSNSNPIEKPDSNENLNSNSNENSNLTPIENPNSNPIENLNANSVKNPNLTITINSSINIVSDSNVENADTSANSTEEPQISSQSSISQTDNQKSEQVKHIKINFSANLQQIAEQNLVFIDKSDDLLKLLSLDYNRVLILRPPFFGKSIICDMIENLFTGQKSIFQSLNAKIINSWDFTHVYPVIRFSMRFHAKTFDEFYLQFSDIVKKLYIQHNIPLDVFSNFGIPQDAIAYLIQTFIDEGQKIVLIIEDIETCLINMRYDNPHIQKIKLCIQQLFNYLVNIRDSFKFLIITGIDNFFELSNLCKDLTESPEIAELFGITKQNIGESNFFILDDESETTEDNFLPFHYKTIIGSFIKTINEVFYFLKDEFIDTLQYIKKSDKSFIHIKYLQHILLNCTGNSFSPSSDVMVSNYYDFLGMCYHCKVDYFWIQSILKRETEYLSKDLINLFRFYPNSSSIYDTVIENALFNEGHEISPSFDDYKYLLRFGLFSYRNKKIYPTNMNIITLLFSASVDHFILHVNINLYSWYSLPLNEIMKSFSNFYKTAKIPLVLKANKCIETILAIYFSSIYKDSQRKILPNGLLFISSSHKNFKFTEVEKLEDHINFFASSDKNVIIHIKSSPEKGESITFYLRINSNLASYSVEVPKYFDSSMSVNTEILGRSGIFSFSDAVLNIVFTSCWGKSEGKDKYFIASELSKKIPELSDDRLLDKKVSLALQLLCQNGKIKYYIDPKKNCACYTLVKNIIPRSNLVQ